MDYLIKRWKNKEQEEPDLFTVNEDQLWEILDTAKVEDSIIAVYRIVCILDWSG